VPVEAAVHLHVDGGPFRAAPALANLVRRRTGGVTALTTLDSNAAGRNVRVIDFEHGINDSALNEKKLHWLERLLALADRTVIVVSNVSPAYVMTTPAPADTEAPAYVERWRALLHHFVIVTAEELDLRHEEWKRRNEAVSQITPPKNWLEKETAYNSFLRLLARELEAENSLRRARTGRDPDTDQRRFLDELGERAETYFAGLWSTCREDEKLILYHLAHNGLANARGRRTIRSLMARGLVRRNPNLELFSESFRLYVLEAGRAAVIKSWQDGEFVLRHLERGDCFGEMALMDFFPRSASVRAVADCAALALAPADLYRLFERDAEQFALIQMNMGREVCRRLRESDEQLFRARMAEARSASDFDTDTVFRAT